MSPFLATVALSVSIGTLGFAGIEHLRKLQGFVDVLDAQAMWPRRLQWPVAVMVSTLELGVAAGVVASLAAGAGEIVVFFVTGAGLLYLMYALYAWLLLRKNPGTLCGCSSRDDLLSGWIPARSVLYGTAALLVAAHDSPGWPVGSAFATVLAGLASVALAVILWHFPSAVSDPYRLGSSIDGEA